jgi:hypothetical protein
MTNLEAVTENNAASYATSRDGRVDLFFKLVRDIGNVPVALKASKRNGLSKTSHNPAVSYHELHSQLFGLIDQSWSMDKLDTMRILFNWRDCREGKGDYWGFLHALVHIMDIGYEWFAANLECVPHYGRYLDLVILWHILGSRLHFSPNNKNYTNARKLIIEFLAERLRTDLKFLHSDAVEATKDISLLAKWLPTEGGRWDVPDAKYLEDSPSYEYKDSFCVEFCKVLFNSAGDSLSTGLLKKYRTDYLVSLRKRIDIIESKLVKRAYSEVDYAKTPSVAMKKYRKAFHRNDEERITAFLESVKKGEVKIKADQVYPHDLVREYINDPHTSKEDGVIEAQWKALKEKVAETGAFKNSLIICDVSGSMDGTPMEVAIALSLLGMLDNQVITFSESPKLHKIPQGSLRKQVSNIMNMSWGYNTDLVKVFDLIFDLAETNPAVRELKRLFIFSDMQFDKADAAAATHLDLIRYRYREKGLRIPQIVFWNLRGGTRDVPARENDQGVLLYSGYSTNLLKSILDDSFITPLMIVREMCDSQRYSLVSEPK